MSPAPAAAGHQSPYASQYGRSPAIRVRLGIGIVIATASRRQSFGVNILVHDDFYAVRQHDLHPARPRRSSGGRAVSDHRPRNTTLSSSPVSRPSRASRREVNNRPGVSHVVAPSPIPAAACSRSPRRSDPSPPPTNGAARRSGSPQAAIPSKLTYDQS